MNRPMTENSDGQRHRVVIVGGGFGGLHAAFALRRDQVDITLIDRRNYHLFQPLLYQVATGSLSPANIAAPLRSIFRRQRNLEVIQAEVVDFDLQNKIVELKDGRVPFDSLIVAAGSTHSYFGHSEWEHLAPGLKTIEDATEIRGRVLSAFERAERETCEEHQKRLLTFVVVGAGPTGVELAGSIAELSKSTLRDDFRHIDPNHAKIILVDAAPRVLSNYPPKLSEKAAGFLDRLGVTLRVGEMVSKIEEGHLMLTKEGNSETIEAETILWAAGVAASPLAKTLAQAAGLETDRPGRISVGADLTIAGHPNVFVIGDMARCIDEHGKPLPGVAPVAIQQGKYAAKTIRARLRDKPIETFQYFDYGNMATIGRKAAVASFGKWQFAGYFAWMLWLFVHLMQLVNFENRVLVFFQWAYSYVTHGRSARLITRDPAATRPMAEVPSSK